jgi:hypothetical protein
MPITNDDQIDYERVIADPDYRRLVIAYLNAQARRAERRRGNAIAYRFERPANQLLRRFG